jgi:hypothetical protein
MIKYISSLVIVASICLILSIYAEASQGEDDVTAKVVKLVKDFDNENYEIRENSSAEITVRAEEIMMRIDYYLLVPREVLEVNPEMVEKILFRNAK